MANVQLSDHLSSELEAIVKQSKEFTDVASYVTYILEQVIAKKKQQQQPVGSAAPTRYSKEDEDKIRERLKNLGYLD